MSSQLRTTDKKPDASNIAGRGVDIPDVQKLDPLFDQEEEEQESEEEEEDADEEAVAEVEERPIQPKPQWFDQAKVSQSCIRSARSRIVTLQTEVEGLVTRLQKALEDHRGTTHPCDGQLAPEAATCKGRLSALRAILDDDPAALAELIKTWGAAKTPSCSGSSTKPDTNQRLRQLELAAPCASFCELVPFRVLFESAERFVDLLSKAAMNEHMKVIGDQIKPVRELLVASKGALSEFLKAVKDMQKARPICQESPRGKRTVATQAKTLALKGTAWFENFVDLGTEVVNAQPGQDVDLSQPALIKLSPEDETHFKSELVNKLLAGFTKLWYVDTRRSGDEGRAIQRVVGGTLPTTCRQKLLALLPGEHVVEPDPSSLLPTSLFEVKNFAFACGRIDATLEKEHMATVRLALRSKSQVIIMPFDAVVRFMRSMGVEGPLPVIKVRQHLLGLSAASIQKISKESCCRAFMEFPNALYIPAHHIVIEKNDATADLMGMKVSLITKDNAAATALESFIEEMKTRGVDTPAMAKLVSEMKRTAAPATRCFEPQTAAEAAARAAQAAGAAPPAAADAAAKAAETAEEPGGERGGH